MRMLAGRQRRVLDFDIENRPLSYWRPDRPTAEITAIAACFTDSPLPPMVWVLGEDDPRHILEDFVELYEMADVVTGHYIRRHDLPIINGALVEAGLPTLSPKLTEDTKLDLVGFADIPKTQEHLAEMMGCAAPKVHMTQSKWREANRLTPAGLELTKERVVGDVLQHMEMRVKLRERGLLKAPRVWSP